MANTFKFGNGEWAVGKETALAYNDENSNFKPLAFTFDRASTATVVNKQGLIETVGTDEPRIDFLNNTKGDLLLEPERTNKNLFSTDFSQFTAVEATLDKSFTAPDGTLNATKLTDNSVNSTHRIIKTCTTSSSGSVTYSVFLKKGTMTNAVLNLFSGSTIGRATVDLDSGTITLNNGTSADIEDYGDDWYRCSVTGTLGSTSTTIYVYMGDSTSSYVGTNQDLYVWGAQLEEGSYATSYIPTQGSAVTRSVDYTNIENSPILQGTNQFTLFFEAKDFLLVNGTNSTFDNIMFVLGAGQSAYDSGTGIHIYNRTWYYFNGTSAVGIGVCYNGLTDGKFAISYDGTRFTRYAGGIKLGEFVTSASMVNWDTITTGAMGDAQNDERNFNLSDLRLYNTALTDAELIQLTS